MQIFESAWSMQSEIITHVYAVVGIQLFWFVFPTYVHTYIDV